jgi:6-pyruvoyltetrahydropterin/6-carboxytetrahydropterin synthase
MYNLTIETVFSAAHALSINGVRETVHGHDWRVTATIEGGVLDNDGLLCDFHTVKEVLEDITGSMNNSDLNTHPAFAGRNASAEWVAKHIFDELHARLDEALAPHARVSSVRVTESPGCAATYSA